MEDKNQNQNVGVVKCSAYQIVGRERRERVSQLTQCGEGCFDSRRRVNSNVGFLPLKSFMKFPCLAFLVALIIVYVLASPCVGQTGEERDWADSNFRPVFEELMPIERADLMNIGFRTHRDLYRSVLEYSFLLTYDYAKNTVTAVERVPENTSIYDQLMKLHRQNPNQSAANLKKLVHIKESHFTEQQCPSIHSLFFQFSKIRFQGPRPDLIVLHPMIYELRTNGGGGNMNLLFVEPDQPLVKWALRVQSALKACASRNR